MNAECSSLNAGQLSSKREGVDGVELQGDGDGGDVEGLDDDDDEGNGRHVHEVPQD